jgi:hypothetical protein
MMVQHSKTKINNNFHNFCSDKLSISITMKSSYLFLQLEDLQNILIVIFKITNTKHKLDALLLTVS